MLCDKQPLADRLRPEKRRFINKSRRLRLIATLLMMRRLQAAPDRHPHRVLDPMLRGIRNASHTWLGRLLMGAVMTLLAGIFALWGINDIFHGFNRTALATIGSVEITSDQFRQAYNDRLQALSQQIGKIITPD